MTKATAVFNDVHIGVERVAGTTPATAVQLRAYVLEQLAKLLTAAKTFNWNVLFNGDIFDRFDVAYRDALEFVRMIDEFLNDAEPGTKVVLGRGNHDIAKDGMKLSMFNFVASILARLHPDSIIVADKTTDLTDSLGFKSVIVPHVDNQDLFDMELNNLIAKSTGERTFLFLHANYHNHFAVEADHSLNVSEEMANKLIDAAGFHLVFGHEHQARHFKGITITGNQIPTSIADCLHNLDNQKVFLLIRPDGTTELMPCWSADGEFVRVDWQKLGEVEGSPKFVRVEGEAASEQASDVVSAVAQFRKTSTALVVTNSVKVEGVQDMEELQMTAAEMKTFDVLEALYEFLGEERTVVVKELLGKRKGGEE